MRCTHRPIPEARVRRSHSFDHRPDSGTGLSGTIERDHQQVGPAFAHLSRMRTFDRRPHGACKKVVSFQVGEGVVSETFDLKKCINKNYICYFIYKFKNTLLKFYMRNEKRIAIFLFADYAKNAGCFALMVFALAGCGESFRYEDFTFIGSEGKTEQVFYKDSKYCEAEKDKHSNKIQGREFGFRGLNEGYFGCMKLKGWEKKASRLY